MCCVAVDEVVNITAVLTAKLPTGYDMYTSVMDYLHDRIPSHSSYFIKFLLLLHIYITDLHVSCSHILCAQGQYCFIILCTSLFMRYTKS